MSDMQSLSMAVDEQTGRPVLIIRDQDEKKRVTGVEAVRKNIAAARMVARILSTSLGPKGADKIIVSPDGEITISNDGATIMEQMDVEHPVAKLMVDLSKCQDNEIGDGTTGVVVLAGALLEQAESLLDRGIHPIRIADGFDIASRIAVAHLRTLGRSLGKTQTEFRDFLIQAASTALGSKIAQGEKLATVAVDAVLAVADMERRDADLSLIKVKGKVGGAVEDTRLIDGIILDKDISHPQMVKKFSDAKIAILTCPFEVPKTKSNTTIEIMGKEAYEALAAGEMAYYQFMIDQVKASGANMVICQWGLEDEANSLLRAANLPTIRWVGGEDIESIAISTGGRIVARFEDLDETKLGHAAEVREELFGTTSENMVIIEGCSNSKTITVFVRGSNDMMIEEAKRSLHDAMCVVRDLIRDPALVPGGGSPEISCSLCVGKEADNLGTTDQYALRGFANALDSVPMALARNSGLQPIETVARIKSMQLNDNNPNLGIDCKQVGEPDMAKQQVYETLASKIQQITLATQVGRMVLKIDDIISKGEM